MSSPGCSVTTDRSGDAQAGLCGDRLASTREAAVNGVQVRVKRPHPGVIIDHP